MEQEGKVPYRVFIIAGSEPLGSAGMQADIKAISACGGYAAGAITCVVNEDTVHVKDIFLMPTDMVIAQAKSFLDDVGADCIKTGMLYSKELVQKVAETVKDYRHTPLLVDPVMVSSAGAQLLKEDAVQSYKQYLIPQATIITPNLREAEILLGRKLNADDIKTDLSELAQWGNSVIVKSVPCQDKLADYYYCPQNDCLKAYVKPIVKTKNVNGTGDMFASSIATYMARGWDVPDAIDRAEEFIDNAIRKGSRFSFGSGFGPVFPFYRDFARLQEENRTYEMQKKQPSQPADASEGLACPSDSPQA